MSILVDSVAAKRRASSSTTACPTLAAALRTWTTSRCIVERTTPTPPSKTLAVTSCRRGKARRVVAPQPIDPNGSPTAAPRRRPFGRNPSPPEPVPPCRRAGAALSVSVYLRGTHGDCLRRGVYPPRPAPARIEASTALGCPLPAAGIWQSRRAGSCPAIPEMLTLKQYRAME